jgi:hypothetical protein
MSKYCCASYRTSGNAPRVDGGKIILKIIRFSDPSVYFRSINRRRHRMKVQKRVKREREEMWKEKQILII